MHTKGHASPDTKDLFRRHAYLSNEEALEKPSEDLLLLFAVIYGFWVGNYVGFPGGNSRGPRGPVQTCENQGASTSADDLWGSPYGDFLDVYGANC